MNRFLMFFFSATLAGLLSSGCYPGGPDFTEDLDVVYTDYDDTYDFQSRSTYAMPDKIVVDIEIDDGDTNYVFMKDAYANQILATIDQNMSALGYQKVDISDSPDLLMMPAGMKSTHYYYWYWYCWWYGGWYGGWGWYYPPYYTVSSYTTGSLIMVLSDPNIDNPIGQSPASWLVVMNGLLSGGAEVDRVLDGVNQAFEQSPYLKTN